MLPTSREYFVSFFGVLFAGGVPVPIYAYGPGAENFTGTLDNTDVYKAILASLETGSNSGSCVQ